MRSLIVTRGSSVGLTLVSWRSYGPRERIQGKLGALLSVVFREGF